MSRVRILIVVLLCLGLVVVPAMAQDEGEETAEEAAGEVKEAKWAGTPYPYTGPDTGAGFGFSIMFRDLFGKKGRDTTFGASYTENQYQDYNISWAEPYFLSPKGRFSIGLGYGTRPALRFNGFGNDTDDKADCNYSSTFYNLDSTYIYRWPKTRVGVIGLRLKVALKFMDVDNGQLDDNSAGNYNRKIRGVYPELYYSEDFDPSFLVGPQVTIYRDTRVDRFPLGGGREEIVWPMKGGYEEFSYQRYDEAIGSDFSFNRISAEVRRFLPLFSEDTILAVRVKINITQGNVPFYEMPNFGNGNDLRGYYNSRFLDKNSTQLNVEIRQGFFPDQELPLVGGAIKVKYPSLFVFWDEGRVYDDYTEIYDDLFEDYHYGFGWGFRFVITPSVVIRFEWGNSDEQTTFYMTAGLPF